MTGRGSTSGAPRSTRDRAVIPIHVTAHEGHVAMCACRSCACVALSMPSSASDIHSVYCSHECLLIYPTFRGVLVTLAIENTADLASVVRDAPDLLQNRTWVAAVSNQVADIARTLHEHSFCHNDLKWRNILVTLEADDPRVYLIDCPEGQRWPAPLLQRRIIKDLACLDKVAKYQLSRTQRLRFFKDYRQIDRLSPDDKVMIRKILAYFEGRE